MINYPPSLKAIGGARTGIAPVNLLDVLTLNGDVYLFSDRLIFGVPSVLTGTAAILPVPPVVAVPAGQGVAWAYPQAVAGAPQPPVTIALQSAFLSMTDRGLPGAWVNWSDFNVPVIPPGAVVVGMYPVLVAAVAGGFNPGFGGGVGVDASAIPPFMPSFISDGTNVGTTMGTSLGDLASITIGANLENSVPFVPGEGTISISFVGIAIYYTLPTYGSPGEPEIPASGIPPAEYLPWLMSVPQIAFHRSLQTDFGSFVLQNVSGDTLSRDFEKLMRRATLEGAFFIYRLWQADAEASWLEVHGTLTVEDVVDSVKLKGTQLINPAQDDTPMFQYCETCQLQWAGKRCGATGSTECQYSYPTCQVPERIFVILNDYEKNYGESTANVAIKPINRRRKI